MLNRVAFAAFWAGWHEGRCLLQSMGMGRKPGRMEMSEISQGWERHRKMQNCRIIGAGGTLGITWAIPMLKQVLYNRLHNKTLRWVLSISRERDSTTFMGNLFCCSSVPGSSPRKQKLSTAQSHSSNPFLLTVYSFSRYFLVTNWFGLQFILQLLVRKKTAPLRSW